MFTKLIVHFVNRFLRRHGYTSIGRIKTLTIDRSRKTITTELLLNGEADPVVVTLTGYEIKGGNKRCDLEWETITASRPWMESTVRMLLPNPIRLMGMAGRVLARVMG